MDENPAPPSLQDRQHALAGEALLHALNGCPDVATAEARVEDISFDNPARKPFEVFRDTMRELCPKNIIAALFEAELVQTAPVLLERHGVFIRPRDALDDTFRFCGHFPVQDFRLEDDKRPVGERKIFKPSELYNYAFHYMGQARADIYLGVNLFINTIYLFANEGQGRTAGLNLNLKDGQIEIFRKLKPWLWQGFEKISSQIFIESADVPMLAAALCVFDRAQNPRNPYITHPTPQRMGAALDWLLHAGFFKKESPKGCPAAVHLLQLMTMPLFKGTPREGMAIAYFIRKAGALVAQDRGWKREAAAISRELLDAASEGGALGHEKYNTTPTGRAMARLKDTLGNVPQLFVMPKPAITLG